MVDLNSIKRDMISAICSENWTEIYRLAEVLIDNGYAAVIKDGVVTIVNDDEAMEYEADINGQVIK